MFLFAMALASSPLPAFDPRLAVAQCVDENDAHDFDAQIECVKGLIRDHREVAALHTYAKPGLRAALDRCVADYSENARPDWNMIEICSGRDKALWTDVSVAGATFDADRARIHCKKEQEQRADLDAEDCFKDEVISHRNFALFKAIYRGAALQSSFRICLERWTTDNETDDWGMVNFCAQDQLDGFERLAPMRAEAGSEDRKQDTRRSKN